MAHIESTQQGIKNRMKMHLKIKNLLTFYQKSTYSFVLFLSGIALIFAFVGNIGLWGFGAITGAIFIVVAGMTALSLLCTLAILALIHKSGRSWRLLLSAPFVMMLGFLAYSSLELAVEVTLYGRIYCPTCP